MNNNITENGISFWKLISKDTIEIPIIQRDYAQGRDDKKTEKIRNGFLADIIETLEKENCSLELDFVYGNVEDNILQPLDGQQRLTTLFLLHWYLAIMTDNLSKNKITLLKFTYETRISSREFCNELVLKGDYLGEGKLLSEKISDSKWFFLSWKKDPTIKAMLIMLDAIQEKLKVKNIEELDIFWKKITSENSPITFFFKELKDIGLTDDLYIKMNARGVPLTDFENFKARFEKYIENSKWELDTLKPTDKFSHKVDTTWTDLFWKHRGTDDLIDNEFIKFIAGLAIINYATNLDIFENEIEDEKIKKELTKKLNGKPVSNEAVKRERIENRIQKLFNLPEEVNPKDFPTKDSFNYLTKCLEIYSKNKNDEIVPTDLPLWDYCKKGIVDINIETKVSNNLFIEFVKNSETTYKQRVLFFSQTLYLLNQNEFKSDAFSEWMRVARNIIQNSTIDSASGFIGAINLINELSSGVENIYEYLSQNKIESSFASNQTSEEKLKASINNFNDIKNVIFSTEDTNFCKGRISFALDCIEFDKNIIESFSYEKLQKIQKVIEIHLNDNDVSNDFRRGLFTIYDNKFYDYWSTSYLYAVEAPKRCLIANINDLYNYAYNNNYKKYLFDLLRKLTINNLETIISNYEIPNEMPNWKKRIIKEKNLLNHSNQHYIAINDEQSCCWLIPQSKVANSKEGVDKCKLIK